jgi:hypothetical protein
MTGILREQARDWLVACVPALHWILLALWVPPLAFAIGVNLGWFESAGSGYPSLRDPSLILSTMQVVLMVAALAGLSHRLRRSWQLSTAALGVWTAHAAWNILLRLRLIGMRDLWSVETLMTLAGVSIAALVLVEVRPRYIAWPSRPRHTPRVPTAVVAASAPMRSPSTVVRRAVPLQGTTSIQANRSRQPGPPAN